MLRQRIANGLAGISLVLAVAALLFLSFWTGAYQIETYSPDGQIVEESTASIIEENGMGVLVWLIFPAVLSMIGFLASFRQTRGARLVMWAGAIVLLLFGLLTGFTIGLFYMPAALTLIIAAAATRSASTDRHPA